ncbi:MAG: hypothetical protein R6V26_03780 [Roseovarius sp.]
MILRLAANAAIHTAGGVALGVTAALAACTVAQVARHGMQRQRRGKTGLDDVPPASPSDPKATDPASV